MEFCSRCGGALPSPASFCPQCGHPVQTANVNEGSKPSVSAHEKGAELEQRIETYFQINGYDTRRDVILEGRSGGKHEVDVLAEKSDGVTSIRIMVECKAWDKPIEKDVVSKVNYVLQDLGLNKAILVALGGDRIGAEQAAQELGVEIWTADELEKKLGKVAIAEMEVREFGRAAIGFPNLTKEETARTLVENETKGMFGGQKEIVKMFKLLWVPCHMFRIDYARSEGMIHKKFITTPVWNLYEALSGSWIYTFEKRPTMRDLRLTRNLQPRVKEKTITTRIVKAFEKRNEVTTPRARARYSARLREFGVPLPAESVSIEETSSVYFPFFMGVVEKNGKERVIAVDGVRGEINKDVGAVLTANIGYVRSIL
jgi:hypothetical protein